jgi:hypothetical protein
MKNKKTNDNYLKELDLNYLPRILKICINLSSAVSIFACGSTTILPPSQSGWTVAAAAAAAAAAAGGSCFPDSLALEAVKRLSLKDLAGSGLGGDTYRRMKTFSSLF